MFAPRSNVQAWPYCRRGRLIRRLRQIGASNARVGTLPELKSRGSTPLPGRDEIRIPPLALAKLAGIVTLRPADAMVAPEHRDFATRRRFDIQQRHGWLLKPCDVRGLIPCTPPKTRKSFMT